MSDLVFVPKSEVYDFLCEAFLKSGLDDFSVSAVVDGLIFASLRGIDSHGVRLAPHYIECAKNGIKNGRPDFQVEELFSSIISVDADNAFGLAAGKFAVQKGADIARTSGICAVSVKNSTHPAAISAITSTVASDGFGVFGFTNADSLMANFGGVKSFFGTNPIAFTCKYENHLYSLDMATTQFTWNKIKIFRALNMPLPNGVAVDGLGNLTTVADDARALLPSGGYKGFALASLVEILTSIYALASLSDEIPAMYNPDLTGPRGVTQFYVVINLGGENGKGQKFQKKIEEMRIRLKKVEGKSDAQVFLPGEIEEKVEKERTVSGIPFDEETLKGFRNVGRDLGIGFA